ncbi:MAG: glycosyltransferase family 4 protein [Gammaproteobacteria bacterium]|nr:glycosyltransferase family 4 protein [Gammaproteobacteria bacterium]
MQNTVLILSPDPAYPVDWGSKRDIWGRIEFFHAEGWRVVFVECGWSKESALTLPPSEIPLEIGYHFVNRRADEWSRVERRETVAELQALVDQYRPRIVLGEYAHFSSLVSALDLHGAKVWFRSHNFEVPHMIERNLAGRPWREWRGYRAPRKAISWIRKLGTDASSRFRKERKMHRIADHVFFISYKDHRYMSMLYGGGAAGKSWVLPFVESDLIPVKADKPVLDVVFVGIHVIGNEQTTVGARKLLTEIIPAVEAAMPGVFRFNIVGRGARKMYGNPDSKAIIIHDYVEDLTGFMQDMDIACLPINIGWGCKIKMIEALAAGLPVIGEPQTFRGVMPVAGAYFVCRSTRDYVENLRLLRDPEIRSRTGLAANAAYISWVSAGNQAMQTALDEA